MLSKIIPIKSTSSTFNHLHPSTLISKLFPHRSSIANWVQTSADAWIVLAEVLYHTTVTSRRIDFLKGRTNFSTTFFQMKFSSIIAMKFFSIFPYFLIFLNFDGFYDFETCISSPSLFQDIRIRVRSTKVATFHHLWWPWFKRVCKTTRVLSSLKC